MTNVRVKVKVADLIKLIEGKKKQVLDDYETRKAEFPEAFEKWKAECAKAIERATPRNVSNSYSGGVYITLPAGPIGPGHKPNTSRFDRDLKLLKMSSDDELTVTASSDFYHYITG